MELTITEMKKAINHDSRVDYLEWEASDRKWWIFLKDGYCFGAFDDSDGKPVGYANESAESVEEAFDMLGDISAGGHA